MQLGFYFNQDLCINCRVCVVACKDWHDVPAGPVSYIRMVSVEKGEYPDVSVHSMFTTCCHCANPACVPACPVEAITKREEDGVVLVDKDLCNGCKLCRKACPYNVPQFEKKKKARMQKCDFCSDRLAKNKNPICVDACIMRALDAGPMEELLAKYGSIQQAEGFVYSEEARPAIVIKPKKDTKHRTVQKVIVSPPSPS